MFRRRFKNQLILNLVLSYFILYPFGQLIKLWMEFNGIFLTGNIIDIPVLILLPLTLLEAKKNEILKESKSFYFLFFILLITFISSFGSFGIYSLTPGFLYFIRFIAYMFFFLNLASLVKEKVIKKGTLVKCLIIEGVLISIAGWIQYFVFPDLRSLYLLGWDDHYFRLVSTFLDPAFTGIILVLSILALISTFDKKVDFFKILLLAFFLLTLGFTYSRASYLAFFIGIVFLLAVKLKQIKLLFLSILFFVLIIPFLPRPGGEGVNLFRSKSIELKMENFSQSIDLIKSSPLFGSGFNNICAAKIKLDRSIDSNSHACGGLDNSVLFILASSGVVGLLAFFHLLKSIYQTTSDNKHGSLLQISFLVVFVHSLFTNTLFYPWILGWFAVLFAISRKEVKE